MDDRYSMLPWASLPANWPSRYKNLSFEEIFSSSASANKFILHQCLLLQKPFVNSALQKIIWQVFVAALLCVLATMVCGGLIIIEFNSERIVNLEKAWTGLEKLLSSLEKELLDVKARLSKQGKKLTSKSGSRDVTTTVWWEWPGQRMKTVQRRFQIS